MRRREYLHLGEQSLAYYVKNINVPTFVAQVDEDSMTRSEDVQAIYDALQIEDKALYWIEGTDRRFDGCNFFGVHPELPLEWVRQAPRVTG